MTNNPPSAQIKPGEYGFPLKLKARYDNFIGGEWVAPADGEYYQNLTPVTGQLLCEVASSGKRDIDLALDAAHKVKDKWAHTSVQDRAAILFKIADRMEQNLELLATAETWDNGKPIRETSAADVPLAIDHFRYFASCIRAQEGGISEVDSETVAYHFHEPLGVVGQIIPWNFPLLMASWKMAPALAAGNCVVLKPARLTPLSVLLLMEIVGDLLPPGVVNVVNGAGGVIGEYLATSKRIAKVAFTGSTEVGQQIMQYATQNIIPVTLELGGKSPNIFFADVMDEEDAFFDKALEGFALFAFNQGEVCTCPSRALVQESIYERFMERAIRRVESIRSGNPLDSVTQMGAQVSHGQLETILNYIDIGKKEGADVLTGGRRKLLEGELKDGYYLEPTILFGQNNMRVFQEEIFGPVLAVTTFKTMEDEALVLLLIEKMRESGDILSHHGWLHLPDHKAGFSEEQQAIWQKAEPLFGDEPWWVRDLAKETGTDEQAMRLTLRQAAQQGIITAIVKDRYYRNDRIVEFANMIRDLDQECGSTCAADFRDRLGVGRKLAIQILEYFDRIGFTRRRGNDHLLRDALLFPEK